MDKLKLMKTANEIRKGIVSSVHSAKAGHPGGSSGGRTCKCDRGCKEKCALL